MVCLADKKFTKKQILKLYGTIYYVQAPLKFNGSRVGDWKIKELTGDKLKDALYNGFLLYDADRCFTTKEDAENYISQHNVNTERK